MRYLVATLCYCARVDRSRSSNTPGGTAGSIKFFSLFGTPLSLHFSFILLVIVVIAKDFAGHQTTSTYTFFLIGMLVSVMLHEAAHAIVANRLHVRTLEVVMFPIGGLPRMERTLKPAEEIWISIAGPMVNAIIAAALFTYIANTHQSAPAPTLTDLIQPSDVNLLGLLAFGNLLLVAMNLLPAFPMDGGRILRALLSYIRPEDEATRIAAWMGRMLAISIGLYGLLSSQFMLVFFALFVYLGAAMEFAAALGRSLTHGIPVRAAMMTEFHTLEHGKTVRDAANMLLATSQQDFPIMHGELVVGLLGRNLLLKALATEGQDAYVAGVMDRDYLSLEPGTDLAEVLPLMAQSGRCALVMDGEKLLGLLTTENLSEFLLLRRFGMEPSA
jgi:Zn-dependent protease/predicted transcriptional regulator